MTWHKILSATPQAHTYSYCHVKLTHVCFCKENHLQSYYVNKGNLNFNIQPTVDLIIKLLQDGYTRPYNSWVFYSHTIQLKEQTIQKIRKSKTKCVAPKILVHSMKPKCTTSTSFNNYLLAKPSINDL